MSLIHQCKIQLPDWVEPWAKSRSSGLTNSESAMHLAISVAKENVKQGTGGPFGAAIVDMGSGQLISLGVNLVTSSGLSIAHAEMVAISLAQSRTGNWNLSEVGSLSLVTSCEPCAMCFGAVPWSGVKHLVCGGTKADAEAAGFDEGEKPESWAQSLRDRNIDVETGVLRAQAAEIFELYRSAGGEIYNAGDGDS
jgi:tRNA(Arg) A34 adenosine deaminase TadA